MGMMGFLATRASMQASLSSDPPHLPLSRALSQLVAGGEGGNEGHPLQAASTPSVAASATPSAAASAAVHEGSESQDGQPDAKTFAQSLESRGLHTPAAESDGRVFHPPSASTPGGLSRVEGLGDEGSEGVKFRTLLSAHTAVRMSSNCGKTRKKRQGCSHQHRDVVC